MRSRHVQLYARHIGSAPSRTVEPNHCMDCAEKTDKMCTRTPCATTTPTTHQTLTRLGPGGWNHVSRTARTSEAFCSAAPRLRGKPPDTHTRGRRSTDARHADTGRGEKQHPEGGVCPRRSAKKCQERNRIRKDLQDPLTELGEAINGLSNELESTNQRSEDQAANERHFSVETENSDQSGTEATAGVQELRKEEEADEASSGMREPRGNCNHAASRTH